MKFYIKISVLLLVAGVVTALCLGIAKGAQRHAVMVEKVQQLSDFEFQDLQGTRFRTKDLDPFKPLLLVAFDPGCLHCEQQALIIRENMERLARHNVLLVSGADKSQILSFAQQHQLLEEPQLTILQDTAGQLSDLFGIRTFPTILLYDDRGALIRQFNGETKIEAIVDQYNNLNCSLPMTK